MKNNIIKVISKGCTIFISAAIISGCATYSTYPPVYFGAPYHTVYYPLYNAYYPYYNSNTYDQGNNYGPNYYAAPSNISVSPSVGFGVGF